MYKPDPNFKFPVKDNFKRQQHFSHDWLKNYSPWLVYSKLCDGGFCLPCVLFAKANRGSRDLGVLVSKQLTIFNKATELLHKQGTQLHYHKSPMGVGIMGQRQPSVLDIANTAHAQLVQQNRLKLTSILNALSFVANKILLYVDIEMMTHHA